MKTLSILTALILTTVTGFSQNICASSFKVNNGNGTCGAAGQLRLSFPGGCPDIMPVIDSVYTNGVKNNVTFATPDNSKCGGNNGYISYCVTSGNMPPADAWTIFFHNNTGSYTCNVVNSTPTSTLPVKLVSFDATLVGNAVNCKWTTENEINNNHFELERSFDGNTFTTVAIIFGAENTTNVKNAYAYADKSASIQNRNIIYYRIKQVDNDGKYTYSYITAVKMSSTLTQSIQVSPNPFVESLLIKFESAETGNGIIKIQSITGQSMATKNTMVNKGSNSLQFDNLNGLSKGVYVAQLSVNGKVVSNQKVIKN
jgi:hypothetical protein